MDRSFVFSRVNTGSASRLSDSRTCNYCSSTDIRTAVRDGMGSHASVSPQVYCPTELTRQVNMRNTFFKKAKKQNPNQIMILSQPILVGTLRGSSTDVPMSGRGPRHRHADGCRRLRAGVEEPGQPQPGDGPPP